MNRAQSLLSPDDNQVQLRDQKMKSQEIARVLLTKTADIDAHGRKKLVIHAEKTLLLIVTTAKNINLLINVKLRILPYI